MLKHAEDPVMCCLVWEVDRGLLEIFLFGFFFSFSCHASVCTLYLYRCLCNSSRAVRAVCIRGTKGCTTAAAEVLLGGTRLISRFGIDTPGNDGSTIVDRAFIIEVLAVTSAKDDVANTTNHPHDTVANTPVSDKTEHKETSDQIDDTTTKGGDHTSASSKNSGGLELDADENKGDDHEVCREHTDGVVCCVTVEADTPSPVVVDTFVVIGGGV